MADKYTSRHTGQQIDDAVDRTETIQTQFQGVQSSVVTVEGKVNQLANRLTDIAEDGLFYTDSAGNIAMSYTPTNGLDAAKVSEHFKSLLPQASLRFWSHDTLPTRYTRGANNNCTWSWDVLSGERYQLKVYAGYGGAYKPWKILDSSGSELSSSNDTLNTFKDVNGGIKTYEFEIPVGGVSLISEGYDARKDLTIGENGSTMLYRRSGCELRKWVTASEDRQQQRELKLLFVGNSYTRNETNYLPVVLERMLPNLRLTMVQLGSGSASVSQHWVQRSTATQIVNGGFSYGGTWYERWDTYKQQWSAAEINTRTLEGCLAEEDWDVIVFQQVSDYATNYNSIRDALQNLVSYCRERVSDKCRIGWMFTHVWNDRYTAAKNVAETTSNERWQSAKEVVKSIMDSYVVDFLIPNGTAVQNMRQIPELNALGADSGHGLSVDGTHLHEGVAELCTAICTTVSITGQLFPVTIEPDARWCVQGAYPNRVRAQEAMIGMSAEYQAIAFHCAVNAINSPYKLTVID